MSKKTKNVGARKMICERFYGTDRSTLLLDANPNRVYVHIALKEDASVSFGFGEAAVLGVGHTLLAAGDSIELDSEAAKSEVSAIGNGAFLKVNTELSSVRDARLAKIAARQTIKISSV